MSKNSTRRTLIATVALCVAFSSSAGAQAAMATCKDGSSSASGKGACSGHGGVDKKATKAAAAAMKPPKAVATKPAPAMATPVAAPTAKPMAKPMTAPMTAPKTVAPATASKPGQPTAKCKDSSMSFSKGHSGACSGHGGVAEWLDGTAKKP